MENQVHAGNPVQNRPGVSLQHLVNSLVDNSLPAAPGIQSAVTNEVGEGVILQTSNARIIALMGEVLNTVIINSRKGDIHIGAEKKGDKMTLKIQERNNYNGYALSFSLGALVSDINFAGAQLYVNTPQNRVVTIYFSFSDRNVA